MKRYLLQYGKWVSAGHVVIVLLVVTGAGCQSLFRPKPREQLIPVEFLVEVPDEVAPAARPPEPDVAPEDTVPDAVPQAKPKPKPKPVEKPKPAETKPLPKPVVKSDKPKPKTPPLTPEQIRKLLEMGATPADRTVIPDVPPSEAQRYLEKIRVVLYDAWKQPGAGEVGNATVEVTIRLRRGGQITDRRITRSSGIPAMDDSVLAAVQSVPWIDGLTPEFLKAYETVSIEFQVR